ncbi:SurA N-terminal domain-containing protein [Ottowia sp.]|uniref:SurA N-terminal domain-containing protein n=1 Tax=Ottowia sp. TaxID=1898956 RepID=UPI002C83DB60|nr:SurA N-terminal domain-containing protein [Ottowia sp.]HRN75196.1 SurA N-terminal domain-containing protein [Ottowia sp.]HRQ01645.1 SurA N-terminal domain-containing protein [Ottowia sp.]
MFDFIRRHTKWGMAILFLLVIPSFVLWGVGDYTQFNEGARKVAEVDGQAITLTEWDNAHRFEVDRLRASNPSIDLNLLDSPAVKYATLERLVRERVIEVAAADSHLIATDARLAAQLQADPSIAALRRPDGSLDMEAYRRLLATQGLTPEGFEARVRAGMSSDQVLGGVLASSLVSQAQVDVAMNAFQERRVARVVRFAPADYAAKLNPSDADLQAFYQANTARYQAPETARVEYLVLDIDSVKKTVNVSEDDLRAYYKQNAATLGTPEERRASHILITAPKDAPAAEREKAKAQATALLAELRQAPDSFAEVARKSSQDDTSASGGGDLGWFQKDRGIDPAISKSTYALAKAGDISEVIESDFGYHIVRVTEIKPAAVPPFEELRPKLEDQLRTQLAQKEFGELAEIFTNGVYEQSDSLQPTAERLKLSVQSADGVTRTPAPGASGPLANAKFLSALFSSDALDKKRNTEALEFGASQLVSGRVVQHNPAHARPFDEVKGDVRTAFTSQRGAEMARQEGAQRLKAWTDQPASASKLPDALVLSRDEPAGQPPQLVEAVLRVDPAKLPSFVGVDLGADGYVIARVDKVLPQAEPKPEQVVQSRDRYEELWLMAEARRYYDFLRDRYKARILEPAPAATAPEAAAAK